MTHPYEFAEPQTQENKQVTAATRFQEEASSTRFSLAANDPIGNRYDACEARSKSTSDSVKCANQAQVSWDVELNKAYKELKQNLTPGQDKALVDAERQWMKFRDAEFSSIDQIYNGQGQGSMTRPWASYARMDVVKQRAVELQNRNGNDTFGTPATRSNSGTEIDNKLAECNMMYIDCLGQNYDDWDAKLNQNYQALRSSLNNKGQDALLQSEREWIKFRDAEFKFLDSTTDSRYSGNRIENLQAKVDIVRQRALKLEHQLEIATMGR